jgi:hypothetical protein
MYAVKDENFHEELKKELNTKNGKFTKKKLQHL